MSRALGELFFPAERRIASNDLVIFSETKGESVLVGIADLVELLGTEVVIAGSEDELENDFFIEEGRNNVEVSGDRA